MPVSGFVPPEPLRQRALAPHRTPPGGNFHAAPGPPPAGQPRRRGGRGPRGSPRRRGRTRARGRGRSGKRRAGRGGPLTGCRGQRGRAAVPQGSPAFRRPAAAGRWGRADFQDAGCAGCVGSGGCDTAVGGDYGISSAFPLTPFKDTAHDDFRAGGGGGVVVVPSAAGVVWQSSSKRRARLGCKNRSRSGQSLKVLRINPPPQLPCRSGAFLWSDAFDFPLTSYKFM